MIILDGGWWFWCLNEVNLKKKKIGFGNTTSPRVAPNNGSPRYNIPLRHKVKHFASNIGEPKFGIEIDQRRGNVGIKGQPTNEDALMEGKTEGKEVERRARFEKIGN